MKLDKAGKCDLVIAKERGGGGVAGEVVHGAKAEGGGRKERKGVYTGG